MIGEEKKVRVRILPLNKDVVCKEGETLYEILKKEGIEIGSTCGGAGTCGKCKVIVHGSKQPFTPNEKRKLSPDEMRRGVRLACQLSLREDIQVYIGEQENNNILTTYEEKNFTIDPPVECHHLVVQLNNERSDVIRIKNSYRADFSRNVELCSLELLRKAPHVIREKDGRITLYVLDGKVMDIRAGHCDPYYGIALDIGTTTIVCRLFDLHTGKMLWTESSINPQVIFGEDIMSRVSSCIKSEKALHDLNHLIIDKVNELIEICLKKSAVDKKDVFEITVVGNTTMLHLFLKIFPKYLGISPFVPTVTDSLNINAPDLGIRLNSHCNVHILPSVSSFVGADHVGAVLSTGLYKEKATSLLIDIGTNTEIALGNRKKLLCCSTPAGPAFEGMNITYGMRAEKGAIDHIMIEKASGRIKLRTIGGGAPRGICGSGLIDAVAEMLKNGILDSQGMIRCIPGFNYKETREGIEFILYEKGRHRVSITQKDIKEIQLAKASIFAGISILVDIYGASLTEIKKIFLAGGFGNYINKNHAVFIGLLPEIKNINIEYVGNAALQGAKMALLSKRYRAIGEKIPKKITYVEISTEDAFEDQFIDSFYFPHKDRRLFPRSTALLEGTQRK